MGLTIHSIAAYVFKMYNGAQLDENDLENYRSW